MHHVIAADARPPLPPGYSAMILRHIIADVSLHLNLNKSCEYILAQAGPRRSGSSPRTGGTGPTSSGSFRSPRQIVVQADRYKVVELI
jgi:hypothetical protein